MDATGTLQSLIDGWAPRGDSPAVMACREPEAEIWSYRRLAEGVQRVAARLLRCGIERGEPVALIGPPSPAWLACGFGIIAAGGMLVPLDSRLPEADLVPLLLDCRCRRLFASRQHARQIEKIEAPPALRIHLLDGDDAEAGAWTELLTENPLPLPALAPEDPAVLFYTSGTTGVPKGVPLSHANLMANVTALLAERFVGPDDRVLLPLPLHHAYPFTVGLLGGLGSGSSLILPASLAGPAFARALAQTTVLLGVPRLYSALVDALDARLTPWQRRLLQLAVWSRQRMGLPLGRWLLAPLRRAVAPSLRIVASGGAKLDDRIAWTLETIGWQVLIGYGLTETAPMLTFSPPGRARLGSAGRPLPGVSLRIAAQDREGVGEIQAKGPNVFQSYWHRPEQTREAFTSDGWFRTGDLGFLDGDGYLHVTSRIKELIVLPSGENVSPEAVERVYEAGAFIREIAVLEQQGALTALIVPDEDALRAHGAGQIEGQLRGDLDRQAQALRPFERVGRFAITREKLPRTPIGKLQRFRLPALWRRAIEGRHQVPPGEPNEADRALLAEPTAAAVWDWLQQRFPGRIGSLDDSPQLDLGLDSLAWLGLTLEIEQRFHRSLGQQAIGRIVTLRDLLGEVSAALELAARPTPPVASPSAPLRALSLVLHLLDRVAMALVFRLRVDGLANLPGAGPCLLVPNHTSYLDPLALAAALPFRRRPEIHWAGWAALLFSTRLMRLLSRAGQVFPVDPEHGSLAGIGTARALLAEGGIVVWFPEGRRSPDGHLQTFHPGIGFLMAATGAPAIPVRIIGSFEAWSRWQHLPRPRQITVVFGQPVTRADVAPPGDSPEIHRHIADHLRGAVIALGTGA